MAKGELLPKEREKIREEPNGRVSGREVSKVKFDVSFSSRSFSPVSVPFLAAFDFRFLVQELRNKKPKENELFTYILEFVDYFMVIQMSVDLDHIAESGIIFKVTTLHHTHTH